MDFKDPYRCLVSLQSHSRLLLLYDYACWYGWLGLAYMLVGLQAHMLLMTLLGLVPPCTIQF